ncbi:NADP-dependent oxidoreductase [Flavobacteriaceae bacterium XHP0103]|uniref:NADP-dependent oxidoreductase n=1 Tax=Marixanthotalea marina TaxID=2844359 RepID=UPI002989F3F2|nr:NADP-dependent oxidoreductase [Marixanthotalea marina]MBU3821527.1 NADP-dependent oxidoreductase [Marixanthotalea marina]
MKAIRIHEKGAIDNIQTEDIPKPNINPNQVLVKVKACGINPVDWKSTIYGYFQMPYTLGTDISGVIEAVGSEVTEYKVGDQVIGSLEWATQGAFAEYVATEPKYLAPKPKNLNFEEAAAVPLVSLTAWQGVFDKLNLQKGQKILVQAAAGGVGLFAIQFAKWKGAEVIGIASQKNESFLKSFGVDGIIDYKTTDFSKISPDFDAVFDSMASSELTIPLLKKGGSYVSITAKPSEELTAKHHVTASNFLFHSNNKQLKTIVDLIEQDQIKVFLDKQFALTEAKAALKYQHEGHSKGKNVLVV